jgi:anti-repressor protein
LPKINRVIFVLLIAESVVDHGKSPPYRFNKEDYTTERRIMNELQIFKNSEFGEIRTVADKVNNVWFCGNDVAKALGYERGAKAISDHVDTEDRHEVPIQDSIGRMQKTAFINESGLYALVLSSKLPDAKKFKRWVTSEVLPSIRKNGGYIAGQESLSDDELMAKALLVAQNKIAERDTLIAEQQRAIEQMKPQKIFAEAVATSHTSILVGDLAKLICQNGVQIGQKRLFQWLRDNGYLIKRKGADWNMPTQKSLELGLFEIKESTHMNGNGCNVTTRTPKATGKAQIYFINKFLGSEKNERFN